jgi:hypothetical protein
MLEDKIISPSTSSWSSPLWIVAKKSDSSGNKKWRIVIDYRKLNSITAGDSYPLPLIADILDQLGHSKYFTTLDLASGFHQIPMKKEDAHKTAFSTPFGHFQYNRLPFGLHTGPVKFQRYMNNVLSGLQGLSAFVYMDDIVVYADNIETHTQKLNEIFKRLDKFNLKLQPDKCEFMRREVVYLGHIISSEGLKTNPDTVRAVKEYPQPKNEREIKSFLGLTGYYRKFIENFSDIARPLTSLLKKDVKFVWTDKQDYAFKTLKEKLTSDPILQFPDFTKQFTLTTDASNYAIGAILSQGPSDLPISYSSRTLNKAEMNYSTIEKELLGIVWSVRHYRPYLFGKKFKIVTDHKPLTWLFNVKDPGSRLVRWRLKLEEFDYEIVYKPGKINSNADALSRIQLENNILQVHSSKDTYKDFMENYYMKNKLDNSNINEIDKSIFSQNNHLAHCISNDKEMSQKIAFEVKELIDNYDEIVSSDSKVGDVLTSPHKDNITIYHVIVKQNYWEKTSYHEIFLGLRNLRNELLKNSHTEVSLPRIGSGYDNLNWNKVPT